MRRLGFILFAGLAMGLIVLPSPAPAQPSEPRRSGFEFMGAATQALQRDDAQNPAMLWVADGRRRWHEAPASAATPAGDAAPRSCAGCHGEAEQSMRGVAARYPVWDDASGRPVKLAQRINFCRERHQQSLAWAAESEGLLALEAYLSLLSRGQALQRPEDPRLAQAIERGRRLFAQPLGQLALSCAQCHDQVAGGRLGGSLIPQGHPTAYPTYRLQWQSIGSLSRRLRGCMTGVRAEPLDAMSIAMVELELFLAARAAGMLHEGPGVRP